MYYSPALLPCTDTAQPDGLQSAGPDLILRHQLFPSSRSAVCMPAARRKMCFTLWPCRKHAKSLTGLTWETRCQNITIWTQFENTPITLCVPVQFIRREPNLQLLSNGHFNHVCNWTWLKLTLCHRQEWQDFNCSVSESLTHSVIHSLSFIHKYVLLRSSIPLWLTVHLASHLFSPFSCPHTHSLLADRQLRLLSSAGAEPLLQITSSRTWFSDGLNVGALPSHFSIMTFDDLLIQIVTATFLQNQNCVQTP